MVTTFVISLAVFFLVLLLSFFKRTAVLPVLWMLISLGGLLQGVLGVIGATVGNTVALWHIAPVSVLGTWGFVLDPLADLMFGVMGSIGFVAALVAAQHSLGKSSGTGRGMAAIVAIQYIATSFLLTATNAIPLLIGWETMSLCAYAYILVNHHSPQVRRAAYVTLFISEVGFLMLVLAVVLASPKNGNFGFISLANHLHSSSPALRDIVLLLALFGFGTKSGVFPTQMWMPDAYDATPPHLSAILAGGLLNLGIFGILRILVLGSAFSLWVGIMIVFIGSIAIFSGALFAVIEDKMRRLLAYSSVENVGFMIVNLGIAMLFSATHNPNFATVALIALFVQMVSHALAKTLAFLSVGEIGRKIGSTSLSDLGGLFRVMPGMTLTLMISALTLGAVAPFSGFASEWLTLQSLLQVYRSFPVSLQTLTVIAGLMTATGAALGFTAFLRLFIFAMTGRTRSASLLQRMHGYQRERLIGLGLGFLAALSTLYGWAPTVLIPLYEHVISELPPFSQSLKQVVPDVFGSPSANHTLISLGAGLFSFLPIRGFVLQPGALVASIAPTYIVLWFLAFSLLAFLLTKIPRHRMYPRRNVPAWLGGRYGDSKAAQYTASAYANPYRMFWATLLRYRVKRQVTQGSDEMMDVKVERNVATWLTADGLRVPLITFRRKLKVVHQIQHGYLWGYLLLMLLALGLLLVWSML